jgi:iron complex outermembrane receptor protein
VETVIVLIELDATIAITDKLLIRPNMTISTNKNKDFSLQEMANRFREYKYCVFSRYLLEMSLLFTGTQFSNIVLSKFVGEQYMGISTLKVLN